MASAAKVFAIIFRVPTRNIVIKFKPLILKVYDQSVYSFSKTKYLAFVIGSATAMSASYVLAKTSVCKIPKNVFAATSTNDGSGPSNSSEVSNPTCHWSLREIRFRQFASIEYEGNMYMSPQDFLESITSDIPRPRLKRTKLSPSELTAIHRKTPSQEQGSTTLFRRMLDKGIISYTEYLFLLCVLTKPHSGFKIAFNMFDTDGNKIVDLHEFLVLQMILGENRSSVKRLSPGAAELRPLQDVLKLENLMKTIVNKRSDENHPCGLQNVDAKGSIVKTTLLVHFFGMNGKSVLNYERFERFMENLQGEIQELEFKEYARGYPTISELDFSRILLRYTLLTEAEINASLRRVEQRLSVERGITFQEYQKFCTFLNNLDDFAIAMKFYSMAGQPISQEQFQRAAMVCTGERLSPNIVRTIFYLFDADNDGHLSHKEFIYIMKDRLHRGSKSHLHHSHGLLDSFKHCVKSEMKLQQS